MFRQRMNNVGHGANCQVIGRRFVNGMKELFPNSGMEKQLHHLQNVIIFLYMLLEKSFIRSNCGELHFVALFSIIWVCNVWCIESVYR